ncbi:unnamed protein product [Paramecium pentaurelia]|uniref:Uncharacterized protein n=1 Tax=Paramecium pentaurelia TaxID=43138 RepID=A0A8S1XRQ0_9CILI|nr:unnamed protein product [Paramecium pentaurelia]
MNQIQEEEFIALTRQQANQLIPSLKSAYYGLVLQGKYLPKQNSSIITSEYLLGVLFETYYVSQIDEINIGVLLKPIKKVELIEELIKIQMNGQKWGIDVKHTPNKEWIVNVLKTLKPDHYIFKNETEITKFDMRKFTTQQKNQRTGLFNREEIKCEEVLQDTQREINGALETQIGVKKVEFTFKNEKKKILNR